MSRPRVTAHYDIESTSERRLLERDWRTSPSVSVEVSFDLHDHEAALAALDRAVDSVKAQIEETRG